MLTFIEAHPWIAYILLLSAWIAFVFYQAHKQRRLPFGPTTTDRPTVPARSVTGTTHGKLSPVAGRDVIQLITKQMTNSPTLELNLIGATLTGLKKAAEGVIVTVLPPRDSDSPELPQRLHIAFIPAVTLNLPPGTETTPENLNRAAHTAQREMMIRTHLGALPNAIAQLAENIEPEVFGILINQTITAAVPPPDGAQGIVLVFGDPPSYGLQIDLVMGSIGVQLLKYQQAQPTETPNAN